MHIKFPALLLLCIAPAARSQAIQVPSAEPSKSPTSATLHQTVNNVLLDVVATDKYGQAIRGLTREHFQVLENGVPQQIAFFEEHEADPAPAVPAHPVQLPPNVYTNIASAGPDTGPTMVLLMDALNTPILDQAKVRTAMLAYLRKIPPGLHIAIFVMTSRLRMLQGFNGDPAALMAALDQAAAGPRQSHLTDDPGKDSYADSMPKLGIGTSGTGASDVLSSYVAHEQAWKTDERVSYTLAALNALATYLSALPGRKNLIWFSGSFPLGMGPDAPMPQGFDPAKFTSENLDRGRNYESALRATSELLKTARVAVYPMDPTALPTPTMFSSTGDNNGSLARSGPIRQMDQEASAEVSSHSTMDTLADSTGGRTFYSTTDPATAIGTVAQLGSNYYTLVYVPSNEKYDGKYRKLVVKVDTPKARLDYRRGYYAEDPEKSGATALPQPSHAASALLHGAPAATGILFKVRVAPTEGAAKASKPNMVRYSVNWSVDLHGVAAPVSTDGVRRASLALAAAAYNSDSRILNSSIVPVALQLKDDEYRLYLKSGLQFHQEIDLPAGEVYLRLAVVESDGDRAGATEIPLNVRPAQAPAGAVQPTAAH